MTKIFLDHKMINADQALITSLTPGVLRAKGAFETMRFERGKVLALEAHLKRLFKCLRFQKIRSPYSMNQLKDLILSIPQTNSRHSAGIRLMVWQDNRRVRVAIVSQPITSLSRRCRAIVSKIIRPKTELSHLKSLDYFCFRRAFLEAKRQGYDEAILLNREGNVVEGSRTNIFFVKNKTLYTSALSSGCLDGITRQVVLKIARQNNIPCRMTKVKAQTLFQSDEAFLTNSIAGIMPLIQVNNRWIGQRKTGPMTKFFQKSYQKIASLDTVK